MAGDQHRVDTGLGPRAVRSLAGDCDVEKRAAGHHRAVADLEFSDREAGPVVHAENHVAWEFVEQPVFDHRLGAAETFLGRLKDEMYGAVEIAAPSEMARRAEQHCRVPVMAAGM